MDNSTTGQMQTHAFNLDCGCPMHLCVQPLLYIAQKSERSMGLVSDGQMGASVHQLPCLRWYDVCTCQQKSIA
jgi:hypothetical protein